LGDTLLDSAVDLLSAFAEVETDEEWQCASFRDLKLHTNGTSEVELLHTCSRERAVVAFLKLL